MCDWNLEEHLYKREIIQYTKFFYTVTGTNSFNYILYDFKPGDEERMRIQTGIIPGEERIIYTLK